MHLGHVINAVGTEPIAAENPSEGARVHGPHPLGQDQMLGFAVLGGKQIADGVVCGPGAIHRPDTNVSACSWHAARRTLAGNRTRGLGSC